MLIFLFITFLAFLADQFAKYLVVSHLYPGESIAVIAPFFYFTHVRNPGGAFGILANQRFVFIFFGILAVIFILIFSRYLLRKQGSTFSLGLGLLFGGILGNLADRLRFNCVIDFFDFKIWPVFNLADVFILLGIIYLIMILFPFRSSDESE